MENDSLLKLMGIGWDKDGYRERESDYEVCEGCDNDECYWCLTKYLENNPVYTCLKPNLCICRNVIDIKYTKCYKCLMKEREKNGNKLCLCCKKYNVYDYVFCYVCHKENKKFNCECGSHIKCKSYDNHTFSKKHINYMNGVKLC